MHDLLTGPGKKIFHILWLSTTATLCALTVNAQELLVHLPLDGTVQNIGTGGAAEVVGAGPVTVQGHIGSAMKFDGHSVIAVPVDLSPEQYPRVTMTAWVRADETAPDTDHSVVSSGSQATTPALRLSKRRYGVKAIMRGGREALLASSYTPTGEWVFIAGTIDLPAQTLHVMQNDSTYNRDDVRTDSLYPASKHVDPNASDADPQAWVFIGARTFNTVLAPAVGIAIDDVRVYGSALTASQLADVRDTTGGQAVVSAGVDLPGQPGGEFTPPDYQSPTEEILRERDGGGTDIDQIEAREEMGSGRDASAPNQPTLTDGTGDRHQLPDQEEIQAQAEQVAGEAAIEGAEQRAAEREEEGRRQAEQEALADAERRAAQEEEAANEDGDPDRPTVWHFSETETHLTGVSGRTGDIIRPDDSFDRFPHDQYAEFYSDAGVNRITVYAENNVPCSIMFSATHEGSVLGDDVRVRFDECAEDNRQGTRRMIDGTIPGAVTALQVCTNPRNGRVKGLEVRGHAIEADGTLGAYSKYTEALPNCSELSTLVVCNRQHAATGIVVHFDNPTRTTSSKPLVGLQLICRKVVKGRP